VAHHRWSEHTWHEPKWEQPAPVPEPAPKAAPRVPRAPSTPPPAHLLSTGGSAAASSSSAPAPPSPADPTAADSAYAAHAKRWAEEARYRALMDQMDWDTFVPNTDRNRDAGQQIKQLADEYMQSFDARTLHPSNAGRWPRQLRVWTAECIWCFDEMQKRRSLPMNLSSPDNYLIRPDAAAAAEGFSDPGNLRLDDVVHVLRLWRYCDPMRVAAVLRVAPGEYGTGRNKSGIGPVNLRGNIVEAVTRALQRMGSHPERRPGPRFSRGGASGSSFPDPHRGGHRDWRW